LNADNDIYDYLETVGKALAIKNKPIPCITIPTTSGTGAEVTKNAVLKSIQFARKASIRHDMMLPVVAIVDPSLTLSCSPSTTAHVGLDTLCQLIEPFVSNAANPITDALAKEGIRRAARSLRTAVANGQNIEAREDMSVASVLGGLALANAKLGAVHGFAAVLGGMFESAPHGAICAALLPHVMRKNAEKLSQLAEAGDRTAVVRLERFKEVARLVTGMSDATVLQGVLWIEALVNDLEVPCVSRLCGMVPEQMQEVCEATAQASSTKGNPLPLTVDELKEIMIKAL
jgi:alcohol dehydrogenase class IV